jgi:hypothetical protein
MLQQLLLLGILHLSAGQLWEPLFLGCLDRLVGGHEGHHLLIISSIWCPSFHLHWGHSNRVLGGHGGRHLLVILLLLCPTFHLRRNVIAQSSIL